MFSLLLKIEMWSQLTWCWIYAQHGHCVPSNSAADTVWYAGKITMTF